MVGKQRAIAKVLRKQQVEAHALAGSASASLKIRPGNAAAGKYANRAKPAKVKMETLSATSRASVLRRTASVTCSGVAVVRSSFPRNPSLLMNAT
jgi:hypothetical protein